MKKKCCWKLKGDSCFVVAGNLAKSCPVVSGKAEIISDETGYIAKKISKQHFEDVPWFLLSFLVKCKRKEVN